MKSQTLGKSISRVEILNIDAHGIWLFVNGKEYFLPFDEFPWFKEAKISDIMDVRFLHGFHLYWPKLDIDLELDSIRSSDEYPLIYK